MAVNNNNRWNQDEDERLRHLVLSNTSAFEIAETLGRTVPAVKARAHSLGLTLARVGIRRNPLARWG
jgi:hypothetical protein